MITLASPILPYITFILSYHPFHQVGADWGRKGSKPKPCMYILHLQICIHIYICMHSVYRCVYIYISYMHQNHIHIMYIYIHVSISYLHIGSSDLGPHFCVRQPPTDIPRPENPEFLVKSVGVSSVRFPVLHIPHGKKTQPGW